MTTSRPRTRRAFVLVALALALAALAAAWPTATPEAGAADAAGWSMTASATTLLRDGDVVSLNIKAQPGTNVGNWEVHQCRLEPQGADTYTSHDQLIADGGNCTAGTTGVSSSSDGIKLRGPGSGLATAARTPRGAGIAYHVGIGDHTWRVPPSDSCASDCTATLTCDDQHPCALVSEVLAGPEGSPFSRTFLVTPLTFTVASPIANCNGKASFALTAASSDRMTDAWTAWTVKNCLQRVAAGQPNGALTVHSFEGEGLAMDGYTKGVTDLIYTGVGYDEGAAIGPADPTERRPSVLVPVALNAAVMATGNGYHPDDGGDETPYHLKMTPAEIADLMTGGPQNLVANDFAAMLARNPSLKTAPDLQAHDQVGNWYAMSETSTTNWVMTRHLVWNAPASFRRYQGNQARYPTASLATANPPFDTAFSSKSGRDAVEKVLEPPGDGPIWVMTDLASTYELGMTPVAIENANGQFVEPTVDTMQAAVPTMMKSAQGARLPYPLAAGAPGTSAATAQAATAQPYPLTFVEYAMVPAEPLVDIECGKRPGAQANLTAWLKYITTTGQDQLPPGLTKLTPELASEAAAAIDKVGAAPITSCTPPPENPIPEETTTTTVDVSSPTTIDPSGSFDGFDTGDSFGGGSFDAGDVTSGPLSASTGGATSGAGYGGDGGGGAARSTTDPGPAGAPPATTPGTSAPDDGEQELALPEYAGSRGASGPRVLLALVGIVGLCSVAALVTSGRGRRTGSQASTGGAPPGGG